MQKRREFSDFTTIIGIALLFLIVIAMNVHLIFEMTSDQAEEIGQMQLERIRSDLQGTIAGAEGTTLRLADKTEQMIATGASPEKIGEFFKQQKAENLAVSDGVCINTYVAGKDWTFIPGFEIPPDFHAEERLWYKGAIEHPGTVYITEPYVDIASGKMCFTMSYLLSDGHTVVALDFNFSNIQKTILQMTTESGRNALIATQDGTIIGYTDMSLAGKNVSRKLPEYEPILERIAQVSGHKSFEADLGGHSQMIFSSETDNGWYMILSVDSFSLYQESYKQSILTVLVSLLMLAVIVAFYLKGVKNRMKAESALRVKEEFLSRLSGKLRDPLGRILKISSAGALGDEDNPAESAAKIRESALHLSNMLDNLFSFSNIISSRPEASVKKHAHETLNLPEVGHKARIRIILVLVLAMTVAIGVCTETTKRWGDSEMRQEADAYDSQLSNWITEQKSILGMFHNLIAERPEIVENYDDAVKFLDSIAKRYPEISVCYMTNPYKEHRVIMNTGWEPDANWQLEKRPWYVGAEKAAGGVHVSAPYYDERTGLYCVTLSQVVYGKNGEFLGIFGIDFYLDKLIRVLGESYEKRGYAFLVDPNGIIINHPHTPYQLAMDRMIDIFSTEYKDAYAETQVTTLEDFRGQRMACLAKKDKTSSFTVIVAKPWWDIYGNIILWGGLLCLLLVICIIVVRVFIDRLLHWQQDANCRLQEAADAAMAAGKAKSQFLAQMSHEIRTPINAVLGMNEMILRESSDEEILDYAENIQSAGGTLLTLINSILDFSKIEDGKMEILPVRYDTATLIDDLLHMIAEKARKKNLKLLTEIDPSLPQSLFGDDVRIRQIITNLLTNAVKYTKEGSVTLSMKGTRMDDDTLELEVKVIDTGIGIRKEDTGKLFDSFQRLDEEKNRNIEGTGLGISIVQKLLAMMGSRLLVESVYGEGSTFSFRLRQKIVDSAPLGNYEESRRHRIRSRKAGQYLRAEGAKILVVDDNSVNLKVIRGLLKRSGIVPDLAESGAECLALAKKNFYHIIFLDHMMPVMDGIETLKRLRTEGILRGITAVIALTANAISGARERYIQEGFDDYLSKPVQGDELEAMIAKYLPSKLVSYGEGSPTKREAEEPPSPKESLRESRNLPEASMPMEPAEPAEAAESEDEQETGDTFSSAEKERFGRMCPDINLELGLSYLMGSKTLLLQIMQEFQEGDREAKIQEAYASKDVESYRILVHALKSTSMTIGASDLSQKALMQEKAAKDNDWTTVQEHHEALMEDLGRTMKGLREYLSSC